MFLVLVMEIICFSASDSLVIYGTLPCVFMNKLTDS